MYFLLTFAFNFFAIFVFFAFNFFQNTRNVFRGTFALNFFAILFFFAFNFFQNARSFSTNFCLWFFPKCKKNQGEKFSGEKNKNFFRNFFLELFFVLFFFLFLL